MDRRSWIRDMTLAGAALFARPLIAAPRKRPNIVYINIDDMGWTDLGCMGSEYYETPNIDRLAREGMLFTDAYAPAANCAPSRACCMSGRYTPAHGIYTVGSSERGKARERKLIPIENNETLPDEIVTIPEALKAGGYATCHAGKWHLGEDPCTQGFDVNIGGCHWGSPHGGYWKPSGFPNLSGKDGEEFLTDRITDETLKFIESKREAPFFLYFATYAVHTPIMTTDELEQKYKAKAGNEAHKRADYAGLIEIADRNVGRILDKLDELGLSENTLLLFTSDNGGVYNISKQWPLRAGKGSYYEGGIREPLIVRWPGKIEAGSKCGVPVIGVDFYPTFLDAAGVSKPDGKKLDGLSLLPLLCGRGELPERPLFWHFPIYLQGGNQETRDLAFRTRPGSALRYGRWKLHEYFEDGALELYDLEKDIGEKNNLAEEMPAKAAELHEILKQWRLANNAPVPSELNPKYRQ